MGSDSQSCSQFIDVLDGFRKYTGLYVDEDDYGQVCAFVAGLQCAYSPSPLAGFNEWLQSKFERRSQRYWGLYVQDVFEESGHSADEYRLKDFLLDLITEYVCEEQR